MHLFIIFFYFDMDKDLNLSNWQGQTFKTVPLKLKLDTEKTMPIVAMKFANAFKKTTKNRCIFQLNMLKMLSLTQPMLNRRQIITKHLTYLCYICKKQLLIKERNLTNCVIWHETYWLTLVKVMSCFILGTNFGEIRIKWNILIL